MTILSACPTLAANEVVTFRTQFRLPEINRICPALSGTVLCIHPTPAVREHRPPSAIVASRLQDTRSWHSKSSELSKLIASETLHVLQHIQQGGHRLQRIVQPQWFRAPVAVNILSSGACRHRIGEAHENQLPKPVHREGFAQHELFQAAIERVQEQHWSRSPALAKSLDQQVRFVPLR